VLDYLRIRSLGVIADAELELTRGLNVVTGETGAGKTMIVTGLQLLLGARADSTTVRDGSGQAVVEAQVSVGADLAAVANVLADLGTEIDEGALVVGRSVGSTGRSRARVGGALVPVSTLSTVMDGVVAVHGQAGQRRLLAAAAQREALDRFGGPSTATTLGEYRRVFDELAAVERELAEITTHARDRIQRADYLRFGLREIAAVRPRPGEDEELRTEVARLTHLDSLRAAAALARRGLTADGEGYGTDVLTTVAEARRALDQAGRNDPRLAGYGEQLAEASYVLSDLAADLSSYLADLDADPGRLDVVNDRLAAITALTRKYGATSAEVVAWAEHATAELVGLDGDDDRRGELESRRGRLAGARTAAAAALTRARRAAASALSAAVTDELAALAMPHTVLFVDVQPAPSLRSHGADLVDFGLAAADGSERRALARSASGGELARVMLALEVVLAEHAPLPVMVFDEVDAGTGGRAAVQVGRRLAKLAGSVQVIVVTHLPQVAAFADRHFQVTKDDAGTVTTSGVRALDEQGRRTELSRMLAGLENSTTALAHADELLEVARAARA
jgi:DNA repair protein RecN (Recombination protein N)